MSLWLIVDEAKRTPFPARAPLRQARGQSRLPLRLMSCPRVAGFAFAAIVLSGGSLYGSPQIPGTRAYVESRKGWDAIRDGRHEDAAAAFAAALDAEPRDPTLHLG